MAKLYSLQVIEDWFRLRVWLCTVWRFRVTRFNILHQIWTGHFTLNGILAYYLHGWAEILFDIASLTWGWAFFALILFIELELSVSLLPRRNDLCVDQKVWFRGYLDEISTAWHPSTRNRSYFCCFFFVPLSHRNFALVICWLTRRNTNVLLDFEALLFLEVCSMD